jgi:uncharacterized protein YbbC (DUF1343 family)
VRYFKIRACLKDTNTFQNRAARFFTNGAEASSLLNIFVIAFTLGVFAFPVLSQNNNSEVIPGAEQVALYKATLKNRTIAVVANQTSMVGKVHLVDTLLSLGAHIKVIFCPEHGFRGNEEAGKLIKSSKDPRTGIPIVSLYGKKLKPSPDDIAGVDVVIYDLQDVGVRYYTYISTLTYMMQACAENFVPLLMILDRPNPNGFYVDGPVMDLKYKSFVGMIPIPLVYGMTPGELAKMITMEGWLPNNDICSIGVIQCKNYTHKTMYWLPVHPSPNLQNMRSVYLYPSLGLLEGTVMNVGRGTHFPFQVFGSPRFADTSFSYIPHATSGSGLGLLHNGQRCFGVDLRDVPEDSLVNKPRIRLEYLQLAYKTYPEKAKFFNSFFENLSGTATLRKQIIAGITADSIRASWKPALDKFKEIRKKYLLYDDFE